MKDLLEDMKKRLKWDTVLSIVVMFILMGIGIYLLIVNFNELIIISQSDVNAITLASEGIATGIRFMIMALVLGFILRIFIVIQRGISPFKKQNVTLLRVAAVTAICGGFIPSGIAFIVRFCLLMESHMTITFTTFGVFFVIFGIILGLLSEVFSYGSYLQEDTDLIA